MAPNQKTATVLLTYKVDRSALNQVKSANTGIIRELNGIDAATKNAAKGYRKLEGDTYELTRATDNWADNLDALRAELSGTVDELGDLRAGLLGAAEAQGILTDEQEAFIRIRENKTGSGGSRLALLSAPQFGAGAGGSNNNDITGSLDRFGRFGTQIAGGLGGGELGNSVGLVGDLADAIGTLGPVGIAATGAIAGLTIGIQLLNTNTENAITTFRAAQAAQQTYYDAVANLTTEQARDQVAELNRTNAILRQQYEEGRRAITGNISELGQSFVDLGNLLGIQAATSITEYQEQLDQLGVTILSNQQAVSRLSDGLDQNIFLVNDVAAANREAAQALEQAAAAARQAAIAAEEAEEASRRQRGQQLDQVYSETYISAVQSTSEAVQAHRDSVLSELEAIRVRNQLDNISADERKRLADRARILLQQDYALADALDYLSLLLPTTTEEIDNMAAAVKGIKGGLIAAGDAAVDVAGILQEEYLKAQKNEKSELEDVIKSRKALVEAEAKAAEEIRQTEIENAEERAKIIIDFNTDATRAEEDLRDDLLKIQRDASIDLQDAVANRDALAFTTAKRQRDKDLSDAKSAADKERNRKMQDYQRQLSDQQQQANRELALQQQQNAAEISLKRADYNVQMSELNTAQTALRLLQRGYYAATLQDANTFGAGLQAALTSAFRQAMGGKGKTPYITQGGMGGIIRIEGAQLPTIDARSGQAALNAVGSILSRQFGVTN